MRVCTGPGDGVGAEAVGGWDNDVFIGGESMERGAMGVSVALIRYRIAINIKENTNWQTYLVVSERDNPRCRAVRMMD